MATNIEKSDKFDLISEGFDNKSEITKVGQLSIKITLPCGCSQVQHPLEMKTEYNHLTNRLRTPEAVSKASQFFEFCNKHKQS